MTTQHAQDAAQHAAEHAASVAKAATYGGGGYAALGGFLFSSQGMALLGLLVGVIGLIANLYFNAERRRMDILRDAREQRESEARLAALQAREK